MYDDFRQRGAFQELLKKNGVVVETMAKDEVGYVLKFKVAPLFSRIVMPRIKSVMSLDAADRSAQRHHSLFISVAPKVAIGSDSAKDWNHEL